MQEDLKGFEEVLDLYVDKQRLSERERQKDLGRNANPFELFNFLEKEKERLAKLDLFFREKLPNIESSPVTEQLLTIQQERREQTEDELIRKLSAPNSPLQKTLEHLFLKSF